MLNTFIQRFQDKIKGRSNWYCSLIFRLTEYYQHHASKFHAISFFPFRFAFLVHDPYEMVQAGKVSDGAYAGAASRL